MARSRRIGSALKMQAEIESLFFQAVDAGDLKTAGYLSQIWVSCENHAKLERAQKKSQKTSLDQLCKILEKSRIELSKKKIDEGDERDEM